MSIKAVLFDLGDTLTETSLNVFETFCTILELNSIMVSVEEVEKAFAVAERELNNPIAAIGKLPCSEFYSTWNLCVLKVLGITREGLERVIHESWSDVSGVTLFPDVTGVLESLRRKNVKTGIISNAYEEEINTVCTRVGLDDFDVVVGSDTVQKAKPDPEVFVYAVEQLGVEPDKSIFVGDNIEKDYKGAEKAGLHPLLIVRNGAEQPASLLCITELTEVLEYVDL